MDKPNQLTTIVQESGLSQESKVEELMKSFTGYFNTAREAAEGAKDIIVTDEAQIDLMLQAREKRLELKNIRVEVEKTRKQLKEQSLREGKAIDGVANVIKALIVPVEEHLEKQEKYAEIKEQERLAKRNAERIESLSKYVEDVSLYNLLDMSDEAFKKLLESSKAAFEAKLEAERKAEAERTELEEKQNVLRHRTLELAPYEDYIDFTYLLDIDTSDDDYQDILKRAKEAKKVELEKQEQIKKENEELRKKQEAEAKKREEAERKLREQKEEQERKEREAKEKAEAEQKAKEEFERKKLLAPDKEKLLEFATALQTIEAPAVKNREANMILEQALGIIDNAIEVLHQGAKSL